MNFLTFGVYRLWEIDDGTERSQDREKRGRSDRYVDQDSVGFDCESFYRSRNVRQLVFGLEVEPASDDVEQITRDFTGSRECLYACFRSSS